MSTRGDRMTERNGGSVAEFLAAATPVRRREDGYAVLDLMRTATGAEPVLWGTSIVGRRPAGAPG